MKRILILVVFFLNLISSAFAQNEYQIQQAVDFYRTNKFRTGEWNNSLSESEIDGSPYLNDEFVNGTIYTNSKQKFIDIPLRYNIYNDALEFKNMEEQIQEMATPEILESAEFGNYTMVYSPYSINKKVHHGFFQVVVSGEASLYLRSNILFKKAEKPAAYKEAVPAQFYKKPDTYFIKIGTAEAKKVNNKKELIEIFPAHKNEVSSFIKKNKIKTNKPEMLFALVEFYNTL